MNQEIIDLLFLFRHHGKMFRIFYAIIISCAHKANGAEKEIYDRNVDDIFESIVGNPKEIKEQMIERGKTYKWYEYTLPPNVSAILQSGLNYTEIDDIITTTQKHIPVTPGKVTEENINMSSNYHYFRLKKIEIKQLLNENDSPLPNFAKDQDNPAHITRRADRLMAGSSQVQPYRREVYLDFMMQNNEHHRIYKMKVMLKNLILHFVYVTRYKLPYMQRLRKKYKGLYKYQIGYCFALLRHLRQQQKNIFSALRDYYNMLTNLLIHMKMYEKIVRLDVDIRDVCKLVKVLNYKRNLEDNPNYYDDSEEGKQPPPMSAGGPRPNAPTGTDALDRSPTGGQPQPPAGVKLPPGVNLPPGVKLPGGGGGRRSPPNVTSISTPPETDTVNKRNMQPPYRVLRKLMPPNPKPYGIQVAGKRSMSLTTPPPVFKNGRRLYAPLPDGMRL